MGFPFTSKTKQEGDEWLVAGLGNPEPRYDGTRHNAGFEALDELAKRWNISINRSKFQGLYGAGTVDGRKVVLLKPLTYMNLSGDSIAAAASFFKIPPQRVLVLCDDIAQAPGKIRIRRQGSAGGHNGLKSIIARLGSQEFPRIRIGVGKSPAPTPIWPTGCWGISPPRTKKQWKAGTATSRTPPG